jgi:hypothetical protein
MFTQGMSTQSTSTQDTSTQDTSRQGTSSNRIFTPSILFYSSFLFITNVLSAFIHEYYIYAFLFINLTITSVMFHSIHTIYTNILDKIAILSIVLYGGWLLYNKITLQNIVMQNVVYVILIILSFITCIIIFFYGYHYKKYFYDPNKYISDQFHCWLHIISSFGHHFITFL